MGMQERAFRPLGATQTATATAASAVVALGYTQGTRAIRVSNVGANQINLAFGNAATVAATTTASMHMLGNTVNIFTMPTDTTHVAIIATSTTGSVVYLQVGEGR